MKKKTGAAALLLLLALLALPLQASALEAEELVPGGGTVGIELKTDGVMIVGLGDVETADGTVRPAEAAGLRAGDVIKRIDGREIDSAAEFLTVLSGADGSALLVEAERGGKAVTFHVTPARNAAGTYQLGLWLRDGVSGIGTMTFYDPATGTYGALGHGINDVGTGELLPFDAGNITGAEVVDVIPGRPGNPGELCGRLDKDAVLGSLERNTDSGIFGAAELTDFGAPVPVAREDEVTLGPAVIRSCVCAGGPKDYAVEISRIYRDTEDNRFLLLTVTDPELLATTGGIVQGMSGSPILQNGKLVGAVTHVLISDCTKGYGISIRKMLEAA